MSESGDVLWRLKAAFVPTGVQNKGNAIKMNPRVTMTQHTEAAKMYMVTRFVVDVRRDEDATLNLAADLLK
jgi:hypothetical protein